MGNQYFDLLRNPVHATPVPKDIPMSSVAHNMGISAYFVVGGGERGGGHDSIHSVPFIRNEAFFRLVLFLIFSQNSTSSVH